MSTGELFDCWVTFCAAINACIPFFVTELENMNNPTSSTCSQDIFALMKVSKNKVNDVS